MGKKENKPTVSDMSQSLLDVLSQAYAGSYVQAHPEMKQNFLASAKRLSEHSDDVDVYRQVKGDLRQLMVDMTIDGGVKEIDSSLTSLAELVMHTDNGSLGRAAGGWAAMLPIWFSGGH